MFSTLPIERSNSNRRSSVEQSKAGDQRSKTFRFSSSRKEWNGTSARQSTSIELYKQKRKQPCISRVQQWHVQIVHI
ncbi:hypothetical protein BLOT_000472 [Blomia tropicalis]|nr:hypothetical protein BLOT_000472 [Blomia tropicalis]